LNSDYNYILDPMFRMTDYRRIKRP